MRPEIAKYLRDILDAASRIEVYVSERSKDEYLLTGELRDAVNWNFVIIGEALSQLSKLDAPTAERISEWRRIIAFRNQLIHGYGVVKNEITWDIIQIKLPVLIADVKNLLAQS